MAIDVTGMSDAGFDYQPSVVAPSVWESALGIETASRLELIARVEAGLNASSIEQFSTLSSISREDLARAVNTSTRTVAHRKEAGKPLDSAVSERLVQLAELYKKVEEVIGSVQLARQWMKTPRF